MKRKSGASDLHANPISIQIVRCPLKVPSAFGVEKLQPFFPPIETLFKTEPLDRVMEYGIKFTEQIVSISETSVRTLSGEYPVHPKITMLLSPYKWMKGQHTSLELPTVSDRASASQTKLQGSNTAGYVGAILSSVLSQSGCEHFPRVFGTYTGISESHTIDISDDYEELSDCSWFTKNVGKTFNLKLNDVPDSYIDYTRSARIPISLGDDVELEEITHLSGVETSETVPAEMSRLFEDDSKSECSGSSSDISTSYIFRIDSASESDNVSIESEADDEPFAWATFTNVPVQMTLMEKLDGTLYDLLSMEDDPQKHFAWLGQVVFALAFAQRNFAFTHNDLHGNNVMYIPTSKEFLYYSNEGIHYKLPTYGYLLKIIDFDRGIGSVKLPGMKEPRVFMSDQFDAKEEAGGQYNIPPFYHSRFPIVKPNASFDLIRLATSLFWDMFPEGPKFDDYLDNPVYKIFMNWLTLQDGSSFLFYKNNPKIDRYSGFDLYKAIARYAKDAIPRKEISKFKAFIGEIPIGETYLHVDK
jgi:hypothetical protein